MNTSDVPQDVSALGRITNEVCYATDESGTYVRELSRGWQVKITALDTVWGDIEGRMAFARSRVMRGEASPLLFHMERALMDVTILADYTGFWKWQIRRHLRPAVFENLSERKLQRYADVFNVSIRDLRNVNVHENGAQLGG